VFYIFLSSMNMKVRLYFIAGGTSTVLTFVRCDYS
jgi:hypothetical protein